MSEHDEQVSLFAWASLAEAQYPELEMMYAIPNGGKRHVTTARKLKAEGVKAGVLDINLDVARGGYHGLRIEMKFGKNKLSPYQEWWKNQYDANGYCVVVCYSCIEAQEAILNYIAGRDHHR
uniref:Putative VRR-NUC domain-containing protein n=1 Tax=viral metagenome TaxID=1070528 RepID=A0A6M3L1H9_9ZZZZ